MSNRIKDLQEAVRERLHSYEEAQAVQLNIAAEANAATASVRRMYRALATAQARLEVAKENANDR
jgi:hypothetical protein